ncbi:AMP-binding protein [Methylobacterium sp. ARG-1]|uniref:AMP-binding protein n=1 Tax=Methylobacterium sp. ARG-1 TaxID=1692501 RepID=UPI000682A724|nr:AMP-binding protein [Methylobacterium sp. ARG-1]KNY21681.1 AMP-dependent synthetase [Methylobacterium sp. ARG-1]
MPSRERAASGRPIDASAQTSYARGRDAQILETTIGEALADAASRWPDLVALVDGGPGNEAQSWTFKDLLALSQTLAAGLAARFAPGERVAIWAANCPEWVIAEFGAALAGITLVTVNPAFGREELSYVLRQSCARGILFQERFRDRDLAAILEEARVDLPELTEIIPLSAWPALMAGEYKEVLPTVRPTDVAQLQYTSGTTGIPKGAMLTHRNLANNGRLYAETIGAREGDVWVNPMPLFHTAGCGLVTLGALQTGGTHVLPRLFESTLMLSLIERFRGTIVLAVPTMLIRMLDDPTLAARDISSWRLVTLGGAPVPPELVARAEALGPNLAIGYGQTEASPYVAHTVPGDPDPKWRATVGQPMPGTEIKIVDAESGATVPAGKIGEICARGYSIMKGYFDLPAATAAAIDGEGWLHTGDLGSIDAGGYCRVQGRLKDMIIRGGENIYPKEIENVLFEHESVADAAVVGVPDSTWGEVPAAFVRPSNKVAACEAEIIAYCRARLASHKVPRIWRFVDAFPETASGKVKKFVLRERLLAEKK